MKKFLTKANNNHNCSRPSFEWIKNDRKKQKKQSRKRKRQKDNSSMQKKKRRKISDQSHKNRLIDQYFMPQNESSNINQIDNDKDEDSQQENENESLLPRKPQYTQKILQQKNKRRQCKIKQEIIILSSPSTLNDENESDSVSPIIQIQENQYDNDNDDDDNDDDDDILLSMDPNKTLGGPDKSQLHSEIPPLIKELDLLLTNNDDNNNKNSYINDNDHDDNDNDDHQYGNNIHLWSDQYAPKSSKDIIGNDKSIKELRQFLINWKEYVSKQIKLQKERNSKSNTKNKGKKNLLSYYCSSRNNRDCYIKRVKKGQNKMNKNKKCRINKKNDNDLMPKSKCILLMGPSGSGKTMTIKLLLKEFGFDSINYSSLDFQDSKDKKNIHCIFDNHKLSWSCNQKQQQQQSWTQAQQFKFDLHLKSRIIVIEDVEYLADTKKLKDIMDAIKITQIPIILIANNYKYCDGIRKLKENNEIKVIYFSRMNNNYSTWISNSTWNNWKMTKALERVYKNHIDIDGNKSVTFIEKMLKEFYYDPRSCLMLLQFWCDTHDISIGDYLNSERSNPLQLSVLSSILSMKNTSFTENDNKIWMNKHDEIINVWEAAKRFFNREKQEMCTLRDGINWYFNHSSIIPLFIFENYLYENHEQLQNLNESLNDFEVISNASNLIADGDILHENIQNHQCFKLMPYQAIISCLHPSKLISKRFGDVSKPKFPRWFQSEKNRKANNKRIDNNNNNKLQYLLDYGPYCLILLSEMINHNNLHKTKIKCEIREILHSYGFMKKCDESENDLSKKKQSITYLKDLQNLMCFKREFLKDSTIKYIVEMLKI